MSPTRAPSNQNHQANRTNETRRPDPPGETPKKGGSFIGSTPSLIAADFLSSSSHARNNLPASNSDGVFASFPPSTVNSKKLYYYPGPEEDNPNFNERSVVVGENEDSNDSTSHALGRVPDGNLEQSFLEIRSNDNLLSFIGPESDTPPEESIDPTSPAAVGLQRNSPNIEPYNAFNTAPTRKDTTTTFTSNQSRCKIKFADQIEAIYFRSVPGEQNAKRANPHPPQPPSEENRPTWERAKSHTQYIDKNKPLLGKKPPFTPDTFSQRKQGKIQANKNSEIPTYSVFHSAGPHARYVMTLELLKKYEISEKLYFGKNKEDREKVDTRVRQFIENKTDEEFEKFESVLNEQTNETYTQVQETLLRELKELGAPQTLGKNTESNVGQHKSALKKQATETYTALEKPLRESTKSNLGQSNPALFFTKASQTIGQKLFHSIFRNRGNKP